VPHGIKGGVKQTLPSGMEFFAALQHFDEERNSPSAGFGLFGGLHAPEDGITVAAFERGKEGFRSGTFIERGLQIRWDSRYALGFIGLLPSTISFGALHLCEACGLHLSVCDQC
jgi:hypothetical protein